MPLQQGGPDLGRLPVRVRHGAAELGGRLAMGAERGRALAGGGGEPEDGGTIAAAVGVLGQPVEQVGVVGPWREQGQRRGMEGLHGGRPERGEDRLADDLVTELVRRRLEPQEPGGDAGVDRRRAHARHPQQALRLGARAEHGGRGQGLSGRLGQPRQPGGHRVLDATGEGRVTRGEGLADEEGVAPGAGQERVHVGRGTVGRDTVGQGGDLVAGEGGDGHPDHRRVGGQVSEPDPGRVVGTQLVGPAGDDDQQGVVLHPAGDEPQQVEGERVGPLDVLDHHDLAAA